MTQAKYMKRVFKAAFIALAEEDGRLRAAAEIREASATRMQADASVASGEGVSGAITAIEHCLAEAAAMRREANEISQRAMALMSPEAPRAPAEAKPPEPPKHTIDDVLFTLEGQSKKGTLLMPDQRGKYADLIRMLHLCCNTKSHIPADLQDLKTLIESIAWPSQIDSYAAVCIKVLAQMIKTGAVYETTLP